MWKQELFANIALKEGATPILYVHAITPNLWVENYSLDNKTWYKFKDIHPGFSRSYTSKDRGCDLAVPDIIGLIKSFAKMETSGSFKDPKQHENIRNAFVIIVYVASEMIRNEILEKALDITTYEPEQRQYTWAELEFLYKHFEKLSHKLYDKKDVYAPTIYINDFLRDYPKFGSNNREAQKALEVIYFLGGPVDPSLLI